MMRGITTLPLTQGLLFTRTFLSALTLFVARVFANDADHALATHHLAVLAQPPN
jgi:hypothetical protein